MLRAAKGNRKKYKYMIDKNQHASLPLSPFSWGVIKRTRAQSSCRIKHWPLG